jgi:hypothetical protein
MLFEDDEWSIVKGSDTKLSSVFRDYSTTLSEGTEETYKNQPRDPLPPEQSA